MKIPAPNLSGLTATGSREYFESDIFLSGPELPIRSVRCHDCPVGFGFYTDISKALAEHDDLKRPVSLRWFCHTSPNKACRGNAEVCGLVAPVTGEDTE